MGLSFLLIVTVSSFFHSAKLSNWLNDFKLQHVNIKPYFNWTKNKVQNKVEINTRKLKEIYVYGCIWKFGLDFGKAFCKQFIVLDVIEGYSLHLIDDKRIEFGIE